MYRDEYTYERRSRFAERMMRFEGRKKSVLLAYLLWFFGGFLGLHRFYLGRVFSGLAMLAFWGVGTLLTVILIGWIPLALWAVWWLLDAFLIPGMAAAENDRLAYRLSR